MAKVVQTTLQISEANVEQYCIADGLSLNTGGYAIRLYLNGHTQGSAILNDAAKEVLYPSATAHPFKIDSFIRANKSGGSMTISLQFNGTSVQSETGDWGTGLKNKIKEGISDPVVINSNRSTEIKWHIKGSSTVSRFSIASTKLTFYFNQYEMRPLVGDNANGIQKVTVSNASPYQGDTVTFTPKLVNGATWDGWYSDAACTNLVSTEQNYSVTPSSDITLYAKATIDATLYNVSAVAGSEITSVSVSDSIVPDGSTATFTAQVNGGCSFEAWYSDNTYTTVVSTENPYTATITADTTLYAKAHISILNISVGTAEHGTASVSATTVLYGDDVTFTFTPEDETWELYGWYSDLALTQLVSEANPYTFTATEDMTLYPKVGKKRYIISFGRDRDFIGGNRFQINIAVLYYDQLTRTEINYLRTGEYHKIDASKILLRDSINDNNGTTSAWKTIKCPSDAYVAVYAPPIGYSTNIDYSWFIKDDEVVTRWPYYWFQPIKDTKITSNSKESNNWCNCSAVLKEGIDYAYATTPTLQGYGAVFEAEVTSGYTFSGWYSDEACTTLVSTDNPAHVTTPTYTTENPSRTSLTLYAKAIKAIYTIRVGTADHCTTSVSSATAQYGDTVTFNCMVNEGYEFNGWYSDEGLTQLVSESAEYVHSVTGNIMLYPKVGIKRYTATIKMHRNPATATITVKIVALQYDQLTKLERRQLKIGNFEQIDQSKIIAIDSDSGAPITREISASVKVPINSTIAIWANWDNPSPKEVLYIADKYYIWITNDVSNLVSPYNYYTFVLQKDEEYRVGGTNIPCHCSAVAMDGIEYASVITPTVQGYNAVFEADLINGYEFAGWYSDEACTQLISTDNPAQVKTPSTGELGTETSLTLYAKATPISSTTGIYLKCNGSWIKAKSVFKKTNGAWVEQEDLSAIFSGESSGTASNYVYGGSV